MQRIFLLSMFFVCGSVLMNAQVVINEITPPNTVEIKNTGATTVDISSYWICQFPSYNQFNALTVVCGALNLFPGQIVTVTINFSLSAADGELALYLTSSFSNPAAIFDYVEWGSSGHIRSSVAQSAGIWTSGDFVPAFTGCASLEYDGSGDASTDWLSQDIATGNCAENSLDGCAPMPIDFISMDIQVSKDRATVSWKIIPDANNDYYVLQYSKDTETWYDLREYDTPVHGRIEHQAYTHRNLDQGLYYYRLKSVSFDGVAGYSPIRSVSIQSEGFTFSVWPNPAQSVIYVNSGQNSEPGEEGAFEIYNATGNLILQSAQQQIDIAALAPGVYLIRDSRTGKSLQRFLKM